MNDDLSKREENEVVELLNGMEEELDRLLNDNWRLNQVDELTSTIREIHKKIERLKFLLVDDS
jgi:uncharacterized coiled-coil DUF342 family protein